MAHKAVQIFIFVSHPREGRYLPDFLEKKNKSFEIVVMLGNGFRFLWGPCFFYRERVDFGMSRDEKKIGTA